MKERQLMKGAAFMLLAATATPPAHAQLKTNAGVQYLLSQSKDMSQDFLDLSNTYFFADSLVSFDTSTGKGTVQWKRQQLMPRQAFNANTYLHQPLQSLDFPETAYDNNPQLTFTVEPVSERTLRIRMLTSPIVPKEDADDPMLIGKPADGRSFWKAEKTDKGTLYTSRYGSLLIQNYPWRLVLKDADGRLLTQTRCWSDNDSTQVKVPPFSFIKRGSDNSRSINPVFSLAPNEKIYGCGESATALNKAGQKVNLFVTDPQGPETPDMYKPIPFFFSNRGYGMFIHTSAPVTCDFGCSYIGATKLFMADEAMDIFIFLGSPKEMLSEYTALVGRPEMPPLWSFGTWMSRITYFSEAEGRDVARKLRENKIPSDVIHFDTGWFSVDWQCDYAFAADRFDNPRQMLTDLRSQGFRTCLWQLPYFTPKNKFFPELVERGLYVRNGKGQLPYEDVVLDFTNPETVQWYQKKLGNLIEMGVGAIKVDFGEGAPLDAIYANGRSGLYEHNLYPLRYNKTVAEVIKKIHGENIIWARSAWAGCQRYPLHWGGDSCSSWDGMAGSLKGGLHFGLSGFAFWSHDVPGFHTLPNFMNSVVADDVYMRWTQFGVFTSHIRYHGTNKREPWHYPAIAPLVKKWWKLRYSLIPYIVEQSKLAIESGYPLLQALILHHPEDKLCWHIDDEYYFGNDFLVAPVMNSENRRDIYLPEGKWVNFFTGEHLEGACWLRDVYVPLEEMPVYVRANAVIPIYPEDVDCTDEMDLSKSMALRIDNDYKGFWNR